MRYRILKPNVAFRRIFRASGPSQAMLDEGLDPENDKPTRPDFVRRVALALGDMQRKGKIEKIGRGRAMGGNWRFQIRR